MAKKVDSNKLTPSEKKDFKAAIIRRQDQVMVVIKGELETDQERVLEQMRVAAGVSASPSDIRALIETADQEIRNAIETNLSSVQQQIEIDTDSVNEEYDQKQREVRERHVREWKVVLDQRKTKLEEMKTRARKAEEEAAATHCADLLAHRKELQLQLLDAQSKEQQIKIDARARGVLANQYRSKAEMIVADAASRALEALLTVNTAEEANKLLLQIPTAGEVLNMCQQGANGLRELFKRLNPGLLLPAPEPVKSKPVEPIDIEVDIPEVISGGIETEDSYTVRQANRSHEAIYTDTQ